jgi:dihydropteroate synthase
VGVYDIILDAGFGFGKTTEDNYILLKNLHVLRVLGLPILAGLSRKSMIWRPLEINPEESLAATTALNLVALQNGASILRVHDVREAVQAIKLFGLLK